MWGGVLHAIQDLTMRLSGAGLHQRQPKALCPDHRLPPWLNEDEVRDRSNRLLDHVARRAPQTHHCPFQRSLERRPANATNQNTKPVAAPSAQNSCNASVVSGPKEQESNGATENSTG
jgi:hypothetical protein